METILQVGGARAELLRRSTRRNGPGPRLVVGVTGGIGSGKTTVTEALARSGAVVADADVIARDVVEPGTAGLTALVERFGEGILTEDGALDRAALASIVFSNARALDALNSITHPLIAERAWRILNATPDGGLAVYDVPLLVENGYADLFDAIIVVDAPIETRVKRLVGRGLTEEDARRRIASQATRDQRRAAATIWIDNDGAEEDLRTLVERLVPQWLT